MTAKEKADKILLNYKCWMLKYDFSPHGKTENLVDVRKSKNDAMKAVNLVLNELNPSARRNYWLLVKDHIKNSNILTMDEEEIKERKEYERLKAKFEKEYER